MKILITGFTPRTTGSDKLTYSIMSNVTPLVKVLRMLGHTVESKPVVVESEIEKEYDLAFVAITVPQSLSSRYVYGALWAVERFGVERTRFFMDDWLATQIQSQFQSALRNPERRLYSLSNRFCFEAAKRHTDVWLKWFQFLSTQKYQLLIPAFPWARPKLLLPKLQNIQPVIFDPTPLALIDPEVTCGSTQPIELTLLPPEQRERKWTLAAMRDIRDWFAKQRFEWPVEKLGNKRMQERIVTERELLNIYGQRWGVLGAPYGSTVAAGGGWRARYIHAAITHSVLLLDTEEGRTAGKPYELWKYKVEKASTDQLVDIAEAQREHLFNNTWTLDQLKQNINAYVVGSQVPAHAV